jgi:hypothetical protein
MVKGWEKTCDETYLVHFYNEKAEKILRLEGVFKDFETRYEKPVWRVSVGGTIHGTLLKDYLRSKSAALKFAMQYMRSHQNG